MNEQGDGRFDDPPVSPAQARPGLRSRSVLFEDTGEVLLWVPILVCVALLVLFTLLSDDQRSQKVGSDGTQVGCAASTDPSC